MALRMPQKFSAKQSVSAFKRPGQFTRAQDLSVSTLQQHTERGKASVSASQVEKREKGLGGAQTSVSRVGSGRRSTSSIIHAREEDKSLQKHGVDSLYDEGADKRRYDFMRRRISARVEKEREEGNVFFSDLVYKTTNKNVEDARIDYKNRIRMKVEIDRARKIGRITPDNAKEYKRRIDKMI